MLDYVGIGKDWHPVILATLRSLDAVHAETARQTSYTAKDRFE
jgi:hypothetical protein